MKNFKRATLAAGLLALSAGAGFAMQVDIVVDKVAQRMHVMVDGQEQYTWLVSTGAPGHDTPSGRFNIFRFDKNHFSKEWDNAPMPNSMFFTALGHAIHGSSHVKALGTPASHGCVRLAPENAIILWDLVQQAGIKNNSVTIKGGFFDNQNLTTADTFKMSSEDLRQASAGTDDAPRRGLFWWAKPQNNSQVQQDRPSFFGSKQPAGSLFGMKKPDKKTAAATDKKATKTVADDSKPAAVKKKKKLVKDDSKKPAVVGASQG